MVNFARPIAFTKHAHNTESQPINMHTIGYSSETRVPEPKVMEM